ncbi:MAG: hypothetical protein ABI947_19345 [Chloroflexota bacterium]
MSKATIVFDLAFSSWKGQRGSGSTGYTELKARLKYFQYRNDRNGHIPQEEGLERWTDRGLGPSWGDILSNCQALGSEKVLAWTLVVSPAPDLMALVPEGQRPELVKSITEQIVETYYTERGVEVPEYSYVLHDRLTNGSQNGGDRIQQLHTHVVLPGTVPVVEGGREPFYNRSRKGHFEQLRDITNTTFATALDKRIGPEWRNLRVPERPLLEPIVPLPEISDADGRSVSELDRWFPRPPTREIE